MGRWRKVRKGLDVEVTHLDFWVLSLPSPAALAEKPAWFEKGNRSRLRSFSGSFRIGTEA